MLERERMWVWGVVRKLGWTPGGESGEGGRGGPKRVCQRVGREVEEEAEAKARRALEAREVAVEARERAVEARSALVAMRERAVEVAAVEAVGDEVRRALGAVEARERAVEARERAVAVEAVEAEVRRTLAAVEAKEREAEAAGRVVDMAVGRAIEAVEGKVRRALVDSAWANGVEGLAGGVSVVGNQSEEKGASEQVDDSSGGHHEAQAVPAEENVEEFGIDPDSDSEVDVELDAGVAEAEGAEAQFRAMSGRDWLRTDPRGRYASVVDVIAALHPPFDRSKGGKTLWNCEHSPAHEYWTSKLRRLSVELHAPPRGQIRGRVPVVHRHMASCGDLETCLAIVNHRTPRPIGTVDADARHGIAQVLRERMVSQMG